ncbi:UNVERIFIED_CONTAM: Polygalacturonase [Sesamum calycinum]|uniref:Polygalacturonase n=1 Tax=Sesamum calycinum TaxID=2727403 RepID=A0AAW2QLU2_9LAMI
MAYTKAIHILILTLFCYSSPSLSATPTYNVQSFGAKPDGKSDCTKAFLSAWGAACAATAPATIYVPRGRRSRAGLWACKNSGKSCPKGATSLAFYNSNNILVSGLTSLNSQMFHVRVDGCHNAKLINLQISAPGNSPNTDGIHVQQSSGVTIMNSHVGTGDDCVSIGPGASNLWIENLACGPGHGISIGSLGWDLQEAGVQNVTVKTATFSGTENGVRVKTWARPSNGFVRDVLFQHLVMNNVQNPIIIDQNYCPDHQNCPNQSSGVKISDVTYEDVHGTSATAIAVKFDCSKTHPCTGITLDEVKLTYGNKPATASCANAGGSAAGVVQPTSCL